MPPRGIVCWRHDQHIEQQLDAILRQQQPRQIPRDRALAVLDVAARHGLGIAEVDLRAGGAGRAEGEAAELQAGGGGLRTLANQVEREFAVLGLGIVIEHLEPVDDGADRADEIMADPRAQQRCEFERIWSGGGTGRRSVRHKGFLELHGTDAANHACLDGCCGFYHSPARGS